MFDDSHVCTHHVPLGFPDDSGALDHAADLAEKAIALDDSAAMPYALRAWIAATKGHWDKAHSYSTQAVSLEPNNA